MIIYNDILDELSRANIKLQSDVDKFRKALHLIAFARDPIKRKSQGEQWCIDIAKEYLGETVPPCKQNNTNKT